MLFRSNSGGGQITITADKMALGSTLDATGSTVTLKSETTGDAIDLGSTVDTTLNTLELSNAELGNITATTLLVGSTIAGAITVSTGISPANITNLSLLSDEGVNDNSNAGTITLAGGLRIDVDTAVDLDQDNDVDTLAVNISGSGALTFTDSDILTIGTVDGVAGITTNDGAVTLNPGGQLDIDAAIDTSNTAGNAITINNDQNIVISGVNLTTNNAVIDVYDVTGSQIEIDTGTVVLSTTAGVGGWVYLGDVISNDGSRLDVEVGTGRIKVYGSRSEERRVGKECRSRWSPYH